jgi:hypothetical protein
MDVSGGILWTWMPAIHAGMTKIFIFVFCERAQDHESLHRPNLPALLVGGSPIQIHR